MSYFSFICNIKIIPLKLYMSLEQLLPYIDTCITSKHTDAQKQYIHIQINTKQTTQYRNTYILYHQ